MQGFAAAGVLAAYHEAETGFGWTNLIGQTAYVAALFMPFTGFAIDAYFHASLTVDLWNFLGFSDPIAAWDAVTAYVAQEGGNILRGEESIPEAILGGQFTPQGPLPRAATFAPGGGGSVANTAGFLGRVAILKGLDAWLMRLARRSLKRVGIRINLADDVNRTFPSHFHAPYKPNTHVFTFATGVEERFVRLHGVGNQRRAWVVKAHAARGLTPQQLQAKFQLPAAPTHISNVDIPVGTEMRYGTINPGFPGAPPMSTRPGRQYQVILDQNGIDNLGWGTPRAL